MQYIELVKNKNRQNDSITLPVLVAEPEQISKHFLEDLERLTALNSKNEVL